MANSLDKQIGDLLRVGFRFDKDGKLSHADEKVNEAWKAFVADNQKRSGDAATVPDTSDEALERTSKANRVNAEGKRILDDEITRTAYQQFPLVEAKTNLQTKAYGDRLGKRVNAYGDLLGRSQLHERDLYGQEGIRLDKIIENDKYYTDTIAGLAEKQLQQQGTANILNLITNLALGGAALFA